MEIAVRFRRRLDMAEEAHERLRHHNTMRRRDIDAYFYNDEGRATMN